MASTTTENTVVPARRPLVRPTTRPVHRFEAPAAATTPLNTIPSVPIVKSLSPAPRPQSGPRELLVHAKGGRKAATREKSALMASLEEVVTLYKSSTNKECDSVTNLCGANPEVLNALKVIITGFRSVQERMTGDRKIFPIADALLEFLRNGDFGYILAKSQSGKTITYPATTKRLIDQLPTLMSGYANTETLSALVRIYLYNHPETLLPTKGKGATQCQVNDEMAQYLSDVLAYKVKESEDRRRKAIATDAKNIPEVFSPRRFASNSAKLLFTYYLGQARDREEEQYIASAELEESVRTEMNLVTEQLGFLMDKRRKDNKAAGVSSSDTTEETNTEEDAQSDE